MAYLVSFTTYKPTRVTLDFDLTRSLKVIGAAAVGLPCVISYWCLIVSNGLTRPLYKT